MNVLGAFFYLAGGAKGLGKLTPRRIDNLPADNKRVMKRNNPNLLTDLIYLYKDMHDGVIKIFIQACWTYQYILN